MVSDRLRFAPPLLACALACAATSAPACAQVLNETVYAEMLADCVSPEHELPDSLVLVSPEGFAFAQPIVIDALRNRGTTVFERSASVSPPSRVPVLTLDVDDAGVSYERDGNRRLRRAIAVRARITVTDASGKVIVAVRCDDTRSDTIPRAALGTVENEAYPVTVGTVPPPGGVSRFVAPAVAATAVVISAYLLFSLRSGSGVDS